MPRLLTAGLVALAIVGMPARGAPDDPPQSKEKSPKEQFQSVLDEYQKAQTAFTKEYSQAKTAEERQKLFQEKYPNPLKYAERFLEIASKYPDDPAGVDALVWSVQVGQGSVIGGKDLGAMLIRHAANPKIERVVPRLVYGLAPSTEDVLRAIVEKNPKREIKGQATFALAQYLNGQVDLVRVMKDNPKSAASVERALRDQGYDQAAIDRLRATDLDALAKRVEALFEKVAKEFDDVARGRETLGKLAAGELNAIRNLGIGKPCPEISGEDIDGKAFKLSDYKGKVVVVDFWGDW